MANGTQTTDEIEKEFLSAIDKTLTALKNKLNSLTTREETFNTTALVLKDNTIHKYNGSGGVTNLNITYPDGNFMSTILFSTAPKGTITVTFPKGTQFSGSAPYEFFPAENWEISIHNGRVVGTTLVK